MEAVYYLIHNITGLAIKIAKFFRLVIQNILSSPRQPHPNSVYGGKAIATQGPRFHLPVPYGPTPYTCYGPQDGLDMYVQSDPYIEPWAQQPEPPSQSARDLFDKYASQLSPKPPRDPAKENKEPLPKEYDINELMDKLRDSELPPDLKP
jgi:hypothetical protein